MISMSAAKFIVIHPFTIFSVTNYSEEFAIVDQYDLPHTDLSEYMCMVVLPFVDQTFLTKHKAIIDRFLAQRKVVCFFGHLSMPWLHQQHMFIPRVIQHHSDYDIALAQAHPIFDGVKVQHMLVNRGVKGFFARGHHPVPPHSEVLLTFTDGTPITYIDRTSTNGTIFVHAGNNLIGPSTMGTESGNSTSRISPQLRQWVQDEYKTLQKGELNDA